MALSGVAVNWLSILVAAVVTFVFGWIWHGLFFGKTWAREMGFTEKDMKKAKEKGMAKPMIWNFIGLLVTAYVVTLFLGWLPITTFGDGMMFAFWAWLGFFAAATMLSSVIWENKSMTLFLINSGYWLVLLELMSLVLLAF
ncbi:MAG: DUF1761 domain-containing protein [Nanoarchaeota archaeon]|nr:DUF1761 domain-containing protein [Nanoarchaeota archaeon]